MTSWTRVCATSDLLPGEYRVIDIDGVQVAVFNYEGEFYAIEDVCTHDGGELTGGIIDGPLIECPRHGARCPPAYEPTAKFPVRIEDGVVFTRDDRWD